MTRRRDDGLPVAFADPRRLKLYIHDYLVKNGFQAAAAQFNAEARLENQAAPINVPEGLLHE